GAMLRYRFEPAGFEQGGSLWVCYDGTRRQDIARIRKSLDPRGDVHGGPEIILAVVEHDREAGSFVDADLQQQILAVVPVIEVAHRLAHAQRGGDRPVG